MIPTATEQASAAAASTREHGAAEDNGRPLPFVLGVIGDSGSGKSTICNGVRRLIGPDNVTDVKLDDYHRYTRAERMERGLTALHPSVHNLSLMEEHLQLLRRGRPIRNRSYDHSDGTFGAVRIIEPRDVVLVRGLLGFPTPELRAAYDLAVFICPEPELLIRWKLRRDVRSRGYKQAEVLKYIVQHLLDAKEFVLPQSKLADMLINYELPDVEAPDTEVRTSLVLRRAAAELLQSSISSFDNFGDAVRVEERGEETVLRIEPTLSDAAVDAWARERFPTYDPGVVGTYMTDGGGVESRAHLTLIEVLVARLTQLMRRVG